jgi:4-carboxymuconolactone decarboxylase
MTTRYERGMKALRKHLGKDAETYIEGISKVAPLFAKVNVEFAYGDIYGDPNRVLDEKTRELCTVSALVVQGFSAPQLKLHIEAALRVGATQKEIVEVITQMILYAGFPAATNAIHIAQAVFEQAGNCITK